MSQGRSLALTQNSFLRPPDNETDSAVPEGQFPGRRKRLANVYDGVAGRFFFFFFARWELNIY